MNLPQGWTLTTFDTILNYEQPTAYIVKSTEYNDIYKTAVLTAGKSFIIGYTNEKDGIYSDNLPAIIFDDFTTAIQYVTFPFKVKSSAMKILQPISEQLEKKYIFYYMQTIKYNVTTHKRYWISGYSKLNIHLPPLLEQYRIVAKIDSLFSELDNGVTMLKTIKEQLAVYRQAVLKWAFARKKYKKIKMKDISNAFGGGAFKSTDFLLSGKYQVIRIGNVRPGIIRYSERPIFLNELSQNEGKYLLEKGDVVITLTGTRKKRDYGFTAVIDKDNLVLNQRIAAIRFYQDYLPKFFMYYSWTNEFKDDFFTDETGNVGQGNVGMKAITETFIPYCSKSEQLAIVSAIESRLSVCDKLEQTIDQTIALSVSLRQSILKKAFEGRLVPQDPNDEPAEKLLERIKEEKESILAKQKQTRKRSRK